MHSTGIRMTNGNIGYGCSHMAQWLPVFNEYCKHIGIVKNSLDVTQIVSNYSKSSGTHREGTCVDVRQTDERVVNAARQYGAPASWVRGPAARPYRPQNGAAITAFSSHTHIHILCPCRSGADYQTADVKRGRDGLAKHGRDYHKPPRMINYADGINAMRSAMKNCRLPDNGATLSVHRIITGARYRDSDPRARYALNTMLCSWGHYRNYHFPREWITHTYTTHTRKAVRELQRRLIKQTDHSSPNRPTRTDGTLDVPTLHYLVEYFARSRHWRVTK